MLVEHVGIEKEKCVFLIHKGDHNWNRCFTKLLHYIKDRCNNTNISNGLKRKIIHLLTCYFNRYTQSNLFFVPC
jgi:hypothetical protein